MQLVHECPGAFEQAIVEILQYLHRRNYFLVEASDADRVAHV